MITITGKTLCLCATRSLGLRDQIPPQDLHRQRAKRHARAVCGGVWGLRGGALRDGRRCRTNTTAGELSAESPALAAGEQPSKAYRAAAFARCIPLCVGVTARVFCGRPVTSPPRLSVRRSASSANTSNNNLFIPAQTRLAPISGLNAKACGAKNPGHHEIAIERQRGTEQAGEDRTTSKTLNCRSHPISAHAGNTASISSSSARPSRR